jgi:glycosyltransferase involved in cell wall biosynthesis
MVPQFPGKVKASIIIPTIDDDPITLQYIDFKKLREDDIELIVVKDRGWRNASRTRNIGAAIAKGEILCFIDDDAAFNFNELINVINEISLGENNKVFYWSALPHILIVKSDIFFKIGGYDERYPLRGSEDTEIRERLKKAGLELKTLNIELKHLREQAYDKRRQIAVNKALTWTYIEYGTYPLRRVIFRKNPIEFARRIIWLIEWLLIRRFRKRSIFYH